MYVQQGHQKWFITNRLVYYGFLVIPWNCDISILISFIIRELYLLYIAWHHLVVQLSFQTGIGYLDIICLKHVLVSPVSDKPLHSLSIGGLLIRWYWPISWHSTIKITFKLVTMGSFTSDLLSKERSVLGRASDFPFEVWYRGWTSGMDLDFSQVC